MAGSGSPGSFIPAAASASATVIPTRTGPRPTVDSFDDWVSDAPVGSVPSESGATVVGVNTVVVVCGGEVVVVV